MPMLNLSIDFLSNHKHEIAVKPWEVLGLHATLADYCPPLTIHLAKASDATDAFGMLRIRNG